MKKNITSTHLSTALQILKKTQGTWEIPNALEKKIEVKKEKKEKTISKNAKNRFW